MIILAAGKGSRLLPLTKNTPKSLIELGNGKTLLESQLESIRNSGVIGEVVIVVGYCWEQIEAKIKKYTGDGMKIKTVFNPFYDSSDTLLSLWLAKNEMDQDFMITNGDNLFNTEVFKELGEKRGGIFLTINKKNKFYEDEMKVIVKEGKIEKVSKSIPNENANYQSVGLVFVSGERNRDIFKQNMEELARNFEYKNKSWLEIFNIIYEKGIMASTFEIDGSTKWREIDLHIDLIELIELIKREGDIG